MDIGDRREPNRGQHNRLAAGLRRHASGRVTAPGDPAWDDERQGWKLTVDQRPAAVLHPHGVSDVVAAVRYAKEHDVAVTAQPTGHGVSDTLNGTIVLRTGGLRGIELDTERRRVRVGAGVRWQQLNAMLSGTGLTGLPGSTGDVSVAGYTVGGGLSWFGRRYGLACEQLIAADLVDADGVQRRVTADSEPDLFWALRGGGGDFGIVTAVELALLDCPPVYGGRLTWPAEHAAQVLTAYAELSATVPDELTMWAWLLELPDVDGVSESLRGRPTVAVDVTYLGNDTACERLLAPMLARLPRATDSTLGPVPLARLGDIAAEPVDPLPVLDDVLLLQGLDEAAVRAVLGARPTNRPSALNVLGFRRLGGALDQPPEGHGAAGAIGQPYMMLTGGLVVGSADPTTDAMEQVRAAVAPYDSGRKPYNFGRDAELVYPPDVLERLRAVKRAHDPDGVIRCNRPVLPGPS